MRHNMSIFFVYITKRLILQHPQTHASYLCIYTLNSSHHIWGCSLFGCYRKSRQWTLHVTSMIAAAGWQWPISCYLAIGFTVLWAAFGDVQWIYVQFTVFLIGPYSLMYTVCVVIKQVITIYGWQHGWNWWHSWGRPKIWHVTIISLLTSTGHQLVSHINFSLSFSSYYLYNYYTSIS